MTLTVLAAFRRAAFAEAGLADVARNLDASVAAVATDEDFVTAVLGEFHDDHTISWVNCGHHCPLLLSSTDEHRDLDTGEPQPPLGLHPTPVVATARWSKGDRILLYTDGLLETRDGRGEFFPFNRTVGCLRAGEPEEALKGLVYAAGRRKPFDLTVSYTEMARFPIWSTVGWLFSPMAMITPDFGRYMCSVRNPSVSPS